jgi:hypothetical protein
MPITLATPAMLATVSDSHDRALAFRVTSLVGLSATNNALPEEDLTFSSAAINSEVSTGIS